MPSYEYKCVVVNEEFEAEHSIKVVLEDCPLCKEAGREPHAPYRLISGGSGRGIVEQTVAELKANMPNEVRKIQRDLMSSEKKIANFVGEQKFHGSELHRTKRR